ncbi:MAG: hypothetical protein EX271_04550 [Acidimicrobiales bacterium]|nr:hypothetical protein [Hyphomonadaceae bacterium]RZV43089.1 MAG: hypothetical protein EX271_04550 [Acidimicrobiales bacterium]
MVRAIKIFIATSAVMAIASGASAADGTTRVEFRYNNLNPVEETYANFQATAEHACLLDVRDSKNVSKFRKNQFMRKCPRKLIGLAVRKTNDELLIQFHKDRRKNRRHQTIIASNLPDQSSRDF